LEMSAEEKESSEEVRKQSRSTHIRVWKDDHNKLMMIRAGTGFKNLAWVVHMLLEEQAKNLATFDSVMAGNVPVVLTGKPLSGKTYFIKQTLLPLLKGSPVLLIDAWNEYTELRNIGYEIYGLNFREFNEHVRFVPNTQSRIAETEVESIFAHLDMKRDDMSRFVIIVEEAHTFKNVSSFLKFLYGSRHVVRKMVAVTPQTDCFQGLITLAIYHQNATVLPITPS
jgi:hypothetical protein